MPRRGQYSPAADSEHRASADRKALLAMPIASAWTNPRHARSRAKPSAACSRWRILRKLRCCAWKAGQLAKAIHALQARENEE
jgi:hypothetical protein